jgi:hypothetical protein
MFGLSKTYADGTFDADAIAAFIDVFKLRLSDAGVMWQWDDADEYRWGPAGAVSGAQVDDTPFWRISGTDYQPYAYIGTPDYVVDEQTNHNAFVSPQTEGVELYAAASFRAGWWWIAARTTTSHALVTLIVGATSRRYSADQVEGLVARFGLINAPDGLHFQVPYAVRQDNGVRIGDAYLSLYSPLGLRRADRHDGSPLPRMIAPLFPASGFSIEDKSTYTAVCMGELDAVMMATDGYAWAEEAAPGWRVFGHADFAFLALRSPADFESF